MFISIEGIEGTGKSTVAQALSQKLLQKGQKVMLTREPGGTEIAESIREVLLKSFANETMEDKVELMLMFASRLQHVQTKIKPALAKGEWVISDRFVDASYAYQGAGRGINDEIISGLHNLSIGGFLPDKTILLDMPPEQAFERVITRGNSKDRIEQEHLEFFNKVRNKYLEQAQKEPNRFIVIAANQKPDEVVQMVWHQVSQWI